MLTVLGKALVESPPWAHTRGGSFSQPQFLSRIYFAKVAKANSFNHSFILNIHIPFKETAYLYLHRNGILMGRVKGLSWLRNWQTWWKRLSRKWKNKGGNRATKARHMIIARKNLCEENLNLKRWRNRPPSPTCLCRNCRPRCLLSNLIGIAISVPSPAPSLLSQQLQLQLQW